MSTSEVTRVDVSPPSEMEIIWEISLLRLHKTVGLDEHFPSCFNDYGEVVTWELTNFLALHSENEQVTSVSH